MTIYKSARGVFGIAIFLAVSLNSVQIAFAANRMYLAIAPHQGWTDTQNQTRPGVVVPHLPMQSREHENDPFADIHME